jgi:hypothetical protein
VRDVIRVREHILVHARQHEAIASSQSIGKFTALNEAEATASR